MIEFQIIDNWVTFFFFPSVTGVSWDVNTENRIIYHGRHLSIYTDGLFISEHFYNCPSKDNSNMCVSNWILLQKFRFIFNSINTCLKVPSASQINISFWNPAPLLDHLSFSQSHWADNRNHGCVFPSWCIYVLDFGFRGSRRKLLREATN